MADEPEGETLDLEDALDPEQPDNDDELPAEAAEEEFTIELEGEEAEEEPDLVKHLRNEVRERDKRLAAYEKTAQPKIEVGPRPKWDDDDINYDEEKMDAALAAWQARKTAAENQEAEAAQQAEVRNRDFQSKAISYKTKLAALPLPEAEKDAAEKTVMAALPELLQSAIVSYADDAAKVVVALAKHPAKLEALSKESDPIKFIIAIRDMEKKLVVNRRKPPAPEAESIQRGSAPATTGDKKGDKILTGLQGGGSLDEYRAHKKTAKAA